MSHSAHAARRTAVGMIIFLRRFRGDIETF
jgi:hypothetical protein